MVTPGRSRAGCRWWIAAIGVMAACLTAGCARTRSETSRRDRLAAELAETLRQEALEVEEASRRERLVTGLIQLRDLMGGAAVLKPTGPAPGGPDVPEPAGGSAPAPEWAMMFAPRSLVIGFFTRSKNFDDVPGPDGLEVRVQPLDAFGDPTKAVGWYRIEVFACRQHTGERRGERLGHWIVSVLDAETNRRYYDPVDRSYVFPLVWNTAIAPGTPVIVQATYYPPGGFTQKLFAQRLIRIEAGDAGAPPETGGEAETDESTAR